MAERDVIETIKYYRKQKRFSQSYMAERLGIEITNYGNLERRKTNITWDRLVKIVEILEINLFVFLSEVTKTSLEDYSNKNSNESEISKLKIENEELKGEITKLKDRIKDKEKIIELYNRMEMIEKVKKDDEDGSIGNDLGLRI